MSSFLFLGTGGSMGVPVIGCRCAVCTSSNPKNKRLRPCGLLHIAGKKILLDAGTDYRCQALTHEINQIDGVILTHGHHDHTAGVDELRVYSADKPLPYLLSRETADEMMKRYGYLFSEESAYALAGKVRMQILEGDRGNTEFLGLALSYTSFYQTGMKVSGFRFADFAYISDIRDYPETIFEDLAGVKILVLSALRYLPNNMHFSVDEAIAFAKKTGAEQTYFTHISHELDHDQTNAYLPPNIRMAYDGLLIPFTY